MARGGPIVVARTYDLPMRVLHVESGRHLYGGAAQVRYLLAGLHAARVDNVLVCAAGGELAAAHDTPAEVIELPMRGDLDLALVGRLTRVLRDVEPDLVHVHSRRGADLFAGIAARLAGVPALCTRRVDAPEPAAWARLKYRPYARLVAISRAIEAQLVRARIAPARITRIPSAVDPTIYRPDPDARDRLLAELDLPRDALLVGVVAQLIARKRHELLLAALPGIARREPRVRVLCFGRGPLAADLRAQIADLGLERHALLAGFRTDLPALLPGLDVLVHPADHEGLGVAVLEASSCAVPVIAAAAGGVVDVLEHGRTGLLFRANDAAALAAALLGLLGDAGARQRLGRDARAEVLRRFGVDTMVGAHLTLYGAIAAESERARSRCGALAPPSRSPSP
jgi:glycosyltransferase involved in cell wall biosynthesis